MSAIELYQPAARAGLRWHDLKRKFRALMILSKRRQRRARLHIEVSRLDERLLYDLGIGPLDARQAIQEQHHRLGLSGPTKRRLELD